MQGLLVAKYLFDILLLRELHHLVMVRNDSSYGIVGSYAVA